MRGKRLIQRFLLKRKLKKARKTQEKRIPEFKPVPIMFSKEDARKLQTVKPLGEKILFLSKTINQNTGNYLSINEIAGLLGKHPVEVKAALERARMVKQ